MTFRKPYYNRYSQAGNDAFGYKTGAQNSEGKTGRSKGWKFVRFVPNTAPQVSEMNELQDILLDAIKDVGDQILNDGYTQGLELISLKAEKKITLSWSKADVPAKVYAAGRFHVVPETTLNVVGTGTEEVAVELIETVITEIEDPDLYNYTVGVETEGGAGAYRVTYTVRPFMRTAANANLYSNSYVIYQLKDGLLAQSASDQLNKVDDNLVAYTKNISGDCVTDGMTVSVSDKDNAELYVAVGQGTAYVNGIQVSSRGYSPQSTPKAKSDTSIVTGEVKAAEVDVSGSGLKKTITPAFGPVAKVTEFNFYVAVKRRGLIGEFPFTQSNNDPTTISINKADPFGPVVRVLAVYSEQTGQALDFQEIDEVGFKLTAGVPSGNVSVVWVYNATLKAEDFSISADKKTIQLTDNYPAALGMGATLDFSTDRAHYVYPGIQNTRLVGATQPNTAVFLGSPNATSLSIVSIDTSLVTNGTYSLEVASGTNLNTYKITYNNISLDNQTWEGNKEITIEGCPVTFKMQANPPASLPATNNVDVTAGNEVIALENYTGLVLDQSLKLMAGSLPSTNDQTVVIKEFVKSNGVITGVRLGSRPAVVYSDNTLIYTDKDFISTNDTNITSGLRLNANFKPVNIDYEWLLDRVDLVCINSKNEIVVVKGQSNKPAVAPLAPTDLLVLAKIYLPANGDAADVVVTPEPVRSLTQKELRQLKILLDQINYNAAVQNLKLNTYNKFTAAGLALRGILTDAFFNSNTLDINANPAVFKNIAIDPTTNTLSPQLSLQSFDLTPNTTESTCYIGSQVIGSQFATSLINDVQNLQVTRRATQMETSPIPDVESFVAENTPFRPYFRITNMAYTGIPTAKPYFSFFNEQTQITENVPSELEAGFWKDKPNSEATPWLANRKLYLPEMTLSLVGNSFYANQTYKVQLDGIQVKNADNSDLEITTTDFTFQTSVVIPAKTILVEKEIVTLSLVNSENKVVASTLFTTSLAAAKKQNIPLTFGSLSLTQEQTYAHIAQTFTLASSKFIKKIALGAYCTNTDPAVATAFEVQIRNTEKSLNSNSLVPGNKVLARKIVVKNSETAGLNLSTFLKEPFVKYQPNINYYGTAGKFPYDQYPVVVELDDPVFCAAGESYAVVVQAWGPTWGFFKTVQNNIIIGINNVALTTKPILNEFFYTSKNGGNWALQANSTLTFGLEECIFRQGNNKLVFNSVQLANNQKLSLIIARAQQLVPAGTSIRWAYSLEDNKTEIPLIIDSDGQLDPVALSQPATKLTLIAYFNSTENVSSFIAKNTKLFSFKPSQLGIYTTRTATSLPAYTGARVTYARLAAAGSASVRVKIATAPNPTGKAQFELSGGPKATDKLTLTIDGIQHVFEYTQTGAASLDNFVSMLKQSLTANVSLSGYTIASVKELNKHIIKIVRNNGSGFIASDITVTTELAGGSTLSVPGTVTADYVLVPQDNKITILDDSYVEVSHLVTNLSPVPVDDFYTFTVQLELLTASPDAQVYPKIHSLAVAVSSAGN